MHVHSSAQLLSDTRRVLLDSNRVLALGLNEADIDAVIDSGLWQKHSKDTTRSYSSAERQYEMLVLSEHHEAEIQVGLDWMESFEGWDAPVRFDGETGMSDRG